MLNGILNVVWNKKKLTGSQLVSSQCILYRGVYANIYADIQVFLIGQESLYDSAAVCAMNIKICMDEDRLMLNIKNYYLRKS